MLDREAHKDFKFDLRPFKCCSYSGHTQRTTDYTLFDKNGHWPICLLIFLFLVKC